MPALRQAAGSVHDYCCKLGQLTKQVRRCQRGVNLGSALISVLLRALSAFSDKSLR